MLLQEILQRVQSLYSKGVQSEDSRLRSRHIYNKLLTARSRLIALQAKKKQKINQWNYQTLSCVELQPDYVSDCPCLDIGCKLLRTVERIPKPLTDLNKHLIQSVTNIDGTIIFNETGFSVRKYSKGRRYATFIPEYFIKDGYLYIMNLKKISAITIVGLFEDPVAVEFFPSICGNTIDMSCMNPYLIDFPIDGELIDPLIELTVQELVVVFRQMGNDRSNDSRDENVNQQQNEN